MATTKIKAPTDQTAPAPLADDLGTPLDQSTPPAAKGTAANASKSNFSLSPTNLFTAYSDANTYTGILNDPFPEFSRISRNKPYPNLAKKYPRVAEGSTAAYIQQKPRDLIQQTPTGDVTAPNGQEWLGLIAQWALDFEIIPNATEDYPVFEKAQNMLEQSLTVGFSVTTAPFYNHDGVWSPDMTMQYWGDVIVPAGYKSIKQMPYVFLRGWWPPERIDAILANPDMAKKGGWDVQALALAKEELSTKDYKAETPSEKSRGLPENYVEIITAFQKGVKAPIYTFTPDSKKILRTKANPDPRGHKNVQELYGLVDGTNPMGMSVLELVGAWQNLMDNDVQAYQYSRAYSVDPATLRRGQIGDGELHPGASFTAQTDDDSIETIDISTQGLTEFPTTYEWQKGVLMNLLNAPTSTENPEAPLGTTPKGLSLAASQISTDDLTFVNHVHQWFQEWAETALNIYFAERKGKQQLTLDDNTVEQLGELADEDPSKFNKKLLNGNVLTFDFDQKLPVFRFKVDGGSSKIQDEAAQLQSLENLLKTITGDPELMQLAGAEKIAALYNKIVAISGVHDSADLLLDLDTIKQQTEAAAQQQEEATQQAAEGAQAVQAKPPSGSIAFKDMPAFGQLQMAAADNIKLRPQDVGLNPDFTPMTDPNAAPPVVPGTPAAAPTVPTVGVVAPTATATPPDVAEPPANPQVPKEMIQAVVTLQKAGLPEILIPHAIQALTEGVPLADILASIKQEAQ